MDPRKTVVIANFDDVIRAAREPSSSAPPATASERPAPIPEWGVQTLVWPSGGEAKGAVPAARERTSDVRETLAQATKAAKASPTVLIGRTVVAGSEPRSLSLAKTQVWRREVTVSEDVSDDGDRQRAQVHVDEAVMEHLSAEVWAGQAQQGSHLMVTTVRRSIVDVSTSSLVETRRNDPQPTIIAETDRITRADSLLRTEVLARVTGDALDRIPRLVRMPEAKTIRIACLALCIASAGAIAMWPPALHDANGPAQPTAASVGVGAAAARNGQSEPVEVESTWRPRTGPIAAADPRRERSSENNAAAVAETERAQPAAADVESEVSPAQKQVAVAVKSPGSNAGAGAGKTAPAVASASASPRAAIDALIAGKQQLALARYRALAKSNPSEPAYETAARILEDAVSRDADQP